jgi:hypothetical protein
MGAAIARFGRLEVPASPKTTYGVGVVRGGTSVNSIPSEVSMDIDLRSESCAELKKVNDAFLAIVREAVDEENKTRSTREGTHRGRIRRSSATGRAGRTPADAPIVQATAAAIRAVRGRPSYTISSTDANVPMSMGIPAVTIGRGGPGGRSHSPDEWADVAPAANVKNVQVVLAILLSVGRRPVIRSDRLSWRPYEALACDRPRVRDFFGGRPRRHHGRADDDGRRGRGRDGPAGSNMSPKITVRVKGLKSRTDMELPPTLNSSSIVDVATKQMIILQHEQKTAQTVDAAAPATPSATPPSATVSRRRGPSRAHRQVAGDRRSQVRRVHLHDVDESLRGDRRTAAARGRRDDEGPHHGHEGLDVGREGPPPARRVRRLPEGAREDRPGRRDAEIDRRQPARPRQDDEGDEPPSTACPT